MEIVANAPLQRPFPAPPMAYLEYIGDPNRWEFRLLQWSAPLSDGRSVDIRRPALAGPVHGSSVRRHGLRGNLVELVCAATDARGGAHARHDEGMATGAQSLPRRGKFLTIRNENTGRLAT